MNIEVDKYCKMLFEVLNDWNSLNHNQRISKLDACHEISKNIMTQLTFSYEI